jgi:hypothetical protein
MSPIRAVVPVGVDDMASERPRLVRLPVNEEGKEGVESSLVESLELQPRRCPTLSVSAEGRSLSVLEVIGPVAQAVTKIGQTHSSGNGSSTRLVQVRFCTRLRAV